MGDLGTMNSPRTILSTTSVLSSLTQGPLRVAIVGAGNFGTVVAKIAATNCEKSYIFKSEVRMWVFEEMVDGRKLTDIINTEHENVKYLPGIKLPRNLYAVSDVIDTVRNANIIVLVTPSQFLRGTLEKIRTANVLASDVRAISFIKGFYAENGFPKLYSNLVEEMFSIPCDVLSGANVANSVAKEEFSECTLGYSHLEHAALWQELFDLPYFKINSVPDKCGVELCGAAKNILAIAYGFCDALQYGTNTKSAIIRIGFDEMKKFCVLFFDDILEDTFWDSAGIADVITTCFGGRNARCAAEFARKEGRVSWEELEESMLQGQKLQGTITAKIFYEILDYHNIKEEFPLMSIIYEIAFQGKPTKSIVDIFMTCSVRPIKTWKHVNKALTDEHMLGLKNIIRDSNRNE